MLGQRIQALRDERALTQVELAELAGMAVSTLSRIEGDQACPRPSTLRKIAHALAVPVTELTAELRAFTPPASEDDVVPMVTLQTLSAGEPADLLLEAREPLQRIAEDVLAGLEADNAGVIATLDCLAKDAARIQGPLAVHGHALALFLATLREETIEHQPEAGVAQAREAGQLLITAIQAKPLGNWEAAEHQVCQRYAALLLQGEPQAFHEAVSAYLLLRARLTLNELVLAEVQSPEAVHARRAATALGTILSLFDLANGARMAVSDSARHGAEVW